MTIEKEKLEKLKQLLKITSDGLTKTEFLLSFKKILKIVLDIEKKLIEKIDNTLNDAINKLSEELKNVNSQELQIAEKTFKDYNDLILKAIDEQHSNLNFIRDKVRKIKEGKDGRTPVKGIDYFDGQPADEEVIVKKILEQIKFPEPEEKALEIDSVEGLEERLKKLEDRPLGRSGGGFSKIAYEIHIIDDETPPETPNGVITDFTIANSPDPPASLKVYKDGQRMRNLEDYTFSGRTITFLSAPLTDSLIVVDYRV